MPDGQLLEFSGVTKRFGAVTAVDAFTARVEPGQVTGFLGPNGAGKTTTLRVLLGLVQATSGSATIGGVPYARLRDPLRTVGAVLEASSFHPGRTGANHLKVYSRAAGLPDSRVDDALGMVGLTDVGGRKVGGYSLGMRQRLGLAYALLGDPGVLVLDEPSNGLDPEGIKWMRGLLRELARQGRTVLVSSHLLAEVQQTVDSLLVIAQGRLVFQGALHELTDPSEYATVVDSPDRAALGDALREAGVEAEVLRSGLVVRGADTVAVGRVAADAGIVLSGLQRRGPALEDVFLDLVNGVRVHPSATSVAPAAEAPAERSTGAPIEQSSDDETAEDAVAEGTDDAGADVGDPDAESATDAGVFVVASTGVIDIVPTAAEPTSSAEVAGADAGADASDVADPADTRPPAEARPPAQWWVPAEVKPLTSPVEVAAAEEQVAAAEGQVAAADEQVEGVPGPDAAAGLDGEEPAPVDPDRPWQEYVKTDADVEADRFFAAFDDGTGTSPDDTATPEDAAPEDAAPEDAAPESAAPGSAEAAPEDGASEASGSDADRQGHDHEEGDQR